MLDKSAQGGQWRYNGKFAAAKPSCKKMLEHLIQKLTHSTGSGQVIPGIDGVRAIAVTLVVIFHIHGFGAGSPPVRLFGLLEISPLLASGYVGVYLFFALSGFLLMLPWANAHHREQNYPALRTFYARRLLRIAPAYYVHLIILFLVLVPIAQSYSKVLSSLGLFTMLAHFTFAHYLFPVNSSGYGINGPLWTLTIEAIFYAALPFIAPLFLGRRAYVSLLIVLVISEAWKYLSFHQFYDFLAWLLPQVTAHSYDPLTIKMFIALQFPSQLFNFGLGMFLANAFVRRNGSNVNGLAGPFGSFTALSVLGALLFLAWFVSRIDVWNTSWLYVWFVLLSMACVLVTFLAAYPNWISEKVLGAGPVRFVGLTSYSIYLWHFPIIYFTKTYFLPESIKGIGAFYYLLLVCLPVILTIGYLSYRYVELPFLSRDRSKPVVAYVLQKLKAAA